MIRLLQRPVVLRLEQLSPRDIQYVIELLGELAQAASDEDKTEIVRSIVEIIESKPGKIVAWPMDPGSLNGSLAKWVAFISKAVREKRKAKGLTQLELAERSGIPQPNISRLEQGKHSPTRLTLERLAAVLEVPIGELDPSAD